MTSTAIFLPPSPAFFVRPSLSVRDYDWFSSPNQQIRNTTRLVYRLLKDGEAYVAQGMTEYEQAYRERTLQNLIRKAKALVLCNQSFHK